MSQDQLLYWFKIHNDHPKELSEWIENYWEEDQYLFFKGFLSKYFEQEDLELIKLVLDMISCALETDWRLLKEENVILLKQVYHKPII